MIKNFNGKNLIKAKKIYNLINDVRIIDWENIILTNKEINIISSLLIKNENNEDITFDIGYRYFRGNKLKIEKGVFVPQFDTEKIVDLVKENINNGNCLEIGSGSGAISISISNETNLKVTSIDINGNAVKLAKKNDIRKNVNFIKIDFNNYKSNKKYDLIISNPPYISINDKEIEKWVKENQPKEALYADNDGLAFYELILNKSKSLLKDNGYIILEIGYNQSQQIIDLFSKDFKSIEIKKDYEGFDRFAVIKKYE